MIPKNQTSIWKAQRTDFTGQVKILSGRAICDGNCPNCKWHAVSQGTWRNLMLSSRCLDESNLNWNSKSPVVNNDLALKSTPSWEVSCVSGFRESGCTLWTASLQTLFFLIRKHRGRNRLKTAHSRSWLLHLTSQQIFVAWSNGCHPPTGWVWEKRVQFDGHERNLSSFFDERWSISKCGDKKKWYHTFGIFQKHIFDDDYTKVWCFVRKCPLVFRGNPDW